MSRLQSVLDGQTNIAKKVYEFVPTQEAYSFLQIYQSIGEITRSAMDKRTFQGCLNTLKEAGLIVEPKRGCFKRVPIKAKEKREFKFMKLLEKSEVNKDQEMAEKKEPIDILALISEKLRGASKTLNSLADDIDSVAIQVSDDANKKSEEAEKLNQLKSILKSLT